MTIRAIDHVVLTVRDVERALSFYEKALGMQAVSVGEGRRALAFGEQNSIYVRDPDGNLIEVASEMPS